MDLAKVLANLHAELDNLNVAIASLERLQNGGRRRGRPPERVQKPSKPEPRRASKAKPDSQHKDEPPPPQGA